MERAADHRDAVHGLVGEDADVPPCAGGDAPGLGGGDAEGGEHFRGPGLGAGCRVGAGEGLARTEGPVREARCGVHDGAPARVGGRVCRPCGGVAQEALRGRVRCGGVPFEPHFMRIAEGHEFGLGRERRKLRKRQSNTQEPRG